MGNDISRRDFMRKSAVGIGIIGVNEIRSLNVSSVKKVSDNIPKRKLGRTGKMVSCIGFGGGSRYWNWVPEEPMAEKLIHHAVRLGITYFDTSIIYGKQKSEKRYGKYLTPKYRNQIFLVSKTDRRKYGEVMEDIETTLKNLNTDYLDLYHMHQVDTVEDVKTLSGAAGGFKAYMKLKNEKVVKYTGFSYHEWNEASKEALERFDPDVVMCPLNAARDSECEENFLPLALERNIGIVAMKVAGQNKLIGNVTGQDLLRYSLSLPVAVANVGMDGFGTLESCVEIAKESLISSKERDAIHKKLAYNPDIHKLPYLQLGYIDGISI